MYQGVFVLFVVVWTIFFSLFQKCGLLGRRNPQEGTSKPSRWWITCLAGSVEEPGPIRRISDRCVCLTVTCFWSEKNDNEFASPSETSWVWVLFHNLGVFQQICVRSEIYGLQFVGGSCAFSNLNWYSHSFPLSAGCLVEDLVSDVLYRGACVFIWRLQLTRRPFHAT